MDDTDTAISPSPAHEPPLGDWLSLVADPRAPAGVDEITRTVESVFRALGRAGPRALDFSKLPAGPLNAEHLAAALRASCSMRGEIPSWDGALARCIDECLRVGIDARDALYGML